MNELHFQDGYWNHVGSHFICTSATTAFIYLSWWIVVHLTIQTVFLLEACRIRFTYMEICIEERASGQSFKWERKVWMFLTTGKDPCAIQCLWSINLQNALLKPAQSHYRLLVLEVVHFEEKHWNISIMLVMTHARYISVDCFVMTDIHKSLKSLECNSLTEKNGYLENCVDGTCQNFEFLTVV